MLGRKSKPPVEKLAHRGPQDLNSFSLTPDFKMLPPSLLHPKSCVPPSYLHPKGTPQGWTLRQQVAQPTSGDLHPQDQRGPFQALALL